MKRAIFFCVLVFNIITFIGCSATLPRVTNEIPIVSSDLNLKVRDKDHTKLVIFNTANPLLYLLTDRLNVYINGKGVTQIDTHEYVQLLLPYGKYQVDLIHHDVFRFPSTHTIELTKPEAYLEIYPTIVSNEANLVPELPKNFLRDFTSAHSK